MKKENEEISRENIMIVIIRILYGERMKKKCMYMEGCTYKGYNHLRLDLLLIFSSLYTFPCTLGPISNDFLSPPPQSLSVASYPLARPDSPSCGIFANTPNDDTTFNQYENPSSHIQFIPSNFYILLSL